MEGENITTTRLGTNLAELKALQSSRSIQAEDADMYHAKEYSEARVVSTRPRE